MDQMWTETPFLPGGWELVSRIAMTIGTAGLLGVLGRCVAVWLRVLRVFLEAAGDGALRGGPVAGPQLRLGKRREQTDIARACRRRPMKPGSRGGRFGAHNLWENLPKEGCYKSDRIVFGTFFNGGLRAFDLENPYQPKEVAYFVPEVPGSPFGSCQLNDVFIDDRGIVFTVDRFVGGLYCLEMDF